jgi:hypothetical protein
MSEERTGANMPTLTKKQSKVNDPSSLADLPRWVAWREEQRARQDGTMYQTKIPYDPNTRGPAQIPTQPSTWGTRDNAERRWERLNNGRDKGGIGLVLGDLGNGSHLLGIDLDACIRKTKGEQLFFEKLANDIINRFNTYTEISPSGKGAKCFFLVAADDMAAVQQLLGFDDGKPKTRKTFAAGTHREIALDRARYYAVTDSTLVGLDRFRVVSVEDIRWLVQEAGPAFLAKYGKAGESDGKPRQGRDETNSGYGYRFFGDCKARGLDYETAWDAIHKDQGPAGEWARYAPQRELKRTFERAQPKRCKDFDQPTKGRPLVSRSVNQFKRRKIEWLWSPFIPRGMLTQFFGDGEVGKSTVLLDLIARISKGEQWPRFAAQEGKRAPPGSVILLCKEDDIARIIRPRLEAAGADLSKIHMLGYEVADDADEFDPLERLDTTIKELERLIAELGDVVAIGIDPITDYVGDIDMYKDDQVRTLLNPLARIAARHNLAVIFVLHLN